MNSQRTKLTGYVLLWMRFRLIDSCIARTHTQNPNEISDKKTAFLQATFNFYLVFDGCRDDYRMNDYVT